MIAQLHRTALLAISPTISISLCISRLVIGGPWQWKFRKQRHARDFVAADSSRLVNFRHYEHAYSRRIAEKRIQIRLESRSLGSLEFGARVQFLARRLSNRRPHPDRYVRKGSTRDTSITKSRGGLGARASPGPEFRTRKDGRGETGHARSMSYSDRGISLSISLPFAGNNEREQLEQSLTGRCDVFLLSSVPSSFSLLLPRLDEKQCSVQQSSRAAIVSFLTSVRRGRNYAHTFPFFPFLSSSLTLGRPFIAVSARGCARGNVHGSTFTRASSRSPLRAPYPLLPSRRSKRNWKTRQWRLAAQLPRAAPSLRSRFFLFFPALPFSCDLIWSQTANRWIRDWQKLIKLGVN
jgi:hypothetical protein